MNKFEWQLQVDALSESRVFAQILALKLGAGDVVELRGELGVGKTALARELIRAVAVDPDLEVPSPTYAIEQIYDLARYPVHHYDFYRLDSPDDANQLGIDDAVAQALVLIEWPERADLRGIEHCVRIDITENESAGPTGRLIKIKAAGPLGDRMARARSIWEFVGEWARTNNVAIGDVQLQYLQGDASARSYARVRTLERHALPPLLLMDSPR
ncbi:MAG: tRNA (adenosine(37)-N6)-threonylcarbamoyltransferase complex ATPase subunit type 1 TsaE, partial [Hyphomicrobiaceae bacterium]